MILIFVHFALVSVLICGSEPNTLKDIVSSTENITDETWARIMKAAHDVREIKTKIMSGMSANKSVEREGVHTRHKSGIGATGMIPDLLKNASAQVREAFLSISDDNFKNKTAEEQLAEWLKIEAILLKDLKKQGTGNDDGKVGQTINVLQEQRNFTHARKNFRLCRRWSNKNCT
ncbi:hypothetical protein ANCCAN_05580 [Ancylostoma caninum]|uniref:Nematode fatty acid retinoid binding protein n=1 Tax=Ancylostoma caninum TaxID=29170 RepID=A0A368GVA6_ANCCA|nr:hypothetical protein ANCCAN_05580 [Ancylostoma caninum]